MTSSTIALVTGANQGIGFAIAKKLASEHKDYHVIMTGRRKDAIEAAAKDLQAQGVPVEALVMDVDSDASVEAAAKAVSEKHGRLDVLINNAGISGASKSSDGKSNTAREELLQIINTNVAGVQSVTDAFIPLLEKATGTKRIVFVSSSIASITLKSDVNHPQRKLDWRPYTISKTAENMLAVCYAAKFDGRDDWKLNMTCPGYCSTNLNGHQGIMPPEHGAINACRLATLGPDGETGTFTDVNGPIPW